MTDPLPAEFLTSPGANPHPANADQRARCPVHPVDHPAAGQGYVVLDHENVSNAFGDPRLSKQLDNTPDWYRDRARENSPIMARNLLVTDPPEHTRLRKLINKAFVPRRMQALRPRVRQIADDLIDAFPESGELDLLREFAIPLPLMVICETLGVPFADRPLFEVWSRVLSQSPYHQGAADQERQQVSDEVEAYFSKALAERRADLREDLMSDLIRAADDGTYSEHELITMMIFMILAGHRTTANMIGNGTQLLLRHPDQYARLRADPGLVDTAVEEFLRYEGSVNRASLRVTTEDIQIGGVDIPTKSFVHLLLASANRDPAVFEDPDRFDITRSPNRHLAFGRGAHFCPGAPLARLEAQVAFPTLLRRLPVLELAVPAEELRWVNDSSIGRGLEELPVRIDGRRPR